MEQSDSSVKRMATFEATFYFVDGTHGHRPIQRANIVIVHRPMHIQRIGTTINTAKCRC